jgi:magnesium transporter
MTLPEMEPDSGQRVLAVDLRDAWPVLDLEARVEAFRFLTSAEAEEFFLGLSARDRAQILRGLPTSEQRWWIRALAPDDVADVVQEMPAEERTALLALIDEPTRKEIVALLCYSEDEAGGLMNPRYARLRLDMSVDEAISYLRRQTRERIESIYYAYVLDEQQRLVGVVSFRQLMMSKGDAAVRDVMEKELITVLDEMDQEAVSRKFAEADLLSIPVVDAEGRMKGIVTADDIVDVVREEATEDIQKIGGTEALGAPYLQVRLGEMLKKRGGWLVALFLGETLTASAMGHYSTELDAGGWIVSAFTPLIISTGGNSGSQASTLVIRAMALGEVKLRDWWRILSREIVIGIALGTVLGLVGFTRIFLWQHLFSYPAKGGDREMHPEWHGLGYYGPHYLYVAGTVALSVLLCALWGTLAGSLLPFLLKRFGLDPASACAPLVATLVDVTGLVIYFTIASMMLTGTLL